MRSTLSGFGQGLVKLGRERGDVVLLHADMAGARSSTLSPRCFPRGRSTAGAQNRTW